MPRVKSESTNPVVQKIVKNTLARHAGLDELRDNNNKPNKETESAAEKMTEKSKKQVSKPSRKRAADSSSSTKNDQNKTAPVPPPKIPKIEKIINVTVHPISQEETDSAVQGLLEAEEREERIMAEYGEYIPKRW
ncbi:hypothetical protein CRE_26685 [Caenorhabditis remanei]|uniref:Uncharacterized protein n=1 Tax=Caenorhabditis remanei TaxID=31234 RepID=E3MKZ4_CAERE|nr:hypothetical protein CRE_26685 [Caenorhabditis remanei]